MEGEEVQLSQITATVDDLDDVDQTAGVIRTQLEKFHKVVDYEIIVPKELLRQAEVLRLMFTLLLHANRRYRLGGRRYRHHEYHARDR